MKKLLFILVVVILFAGCANISAPGGGPKDTKGPSIVDIFPENNSTNIDRFATIIVDFDERIEFEPKHVFISPPNPVFEVKPYAKGFELRPQGQLLENQTYVISISSEMEDLRGNNFSGMQIALTTGDFLDSMSISGEIYDSKLNVSKSSAVLLWSLPFDTLRTPEYIGWTDSLGKFSIEYLKPGQYFISAFSELYPNNVPKLDKEYSTNVSNIYLTNKNVNNLLFILGQHDTSEVYVRLISQKDSYSFEVQFSSEIKIVDQTQVVGFSGFENLRKIPSSGKSKNIRFFSNTHLPDGEYNLKLENVLTPDGTYASFDSLSLMIAEKEDSVLPAIISRKPTSSDIVVSEQVLTCEFSIPVRSAIFELYYDVLDSAAGRLDSNGVLIPDTLNKRITGELDTSNPYMFNFIPTKALSDSMLNIRWKVTSAKAYNGLEISDTTWTKIRISNKKEGSILLIADSLDCENVIYKLIKGSTEYTLEKTDSGYFCEKISAGDYSLWGFCDSDGDSLYNSGKIGLLSSMLDDEFMKFNGLGCEITDYLFSEKAIVYPDSVQIRGNWITEVGW